MKTNGMLLAVLLVFGTIPLMIGKLFFIVDFAGMKPADLVAYVFIISLIFLPFYVVLVEMQDKTLNEFLKGLKRMLTGGGVAEKEIKNEMFSEVYSVITDCQQKVAEKELALEEAADLENMFWSFGTDKFFVVNVTDNKFVYGLDKWEQRQLDTDSYSEQMEFIAQKLLDPYYVKDFLRVFNNENLTKLDKSGRDRIIFDCKMKSEQNKFIWVRIMGSLQFDMKKIKLMARLCIREIDQQKKLEKELLALEQLDISTGFYSRMSGKKIMEDFLEDEGAFAKHALIIMNLTGFKQIAADFGEVTFEHFMQKIASRLLEKYKETSFIFRNSENQIIILLKDLEEPDLEVELKNITELCQESVILGDKELKLAPKVGAALYPDTGKSYAQLFHFANRALLYIEHLEQEGEVVDWIVYSADFEKIL